MQGLRVRGLRAGARGILKDYVTKLATVGKCALNHIMAFFWSSPESFIISEQIAPFGKKNYFLGSSQLE